MSTSYKLSDFVLDNMLEVSAEADIYKVSLPYVGQVVKVNSSGKYYRIDALGDGEIDGQTVKNYKVVSVSELSASYGIDNQKRPTTKQITDCAAARTGYESAWHEEQQLTGAAKTMQETVDKVDAARKNFVAACGQPEEAAYETSYVASVPESRGSRYVMFTFRTMVPRSALAGCDAEIDWGDGTSTVFKKLADYDAGRIVDENDEPVPWAPGMENISSWCWSDWGDGEWLCQPKHEYAAGGDYTVTIKGKDIWAIGAAGSGLSRASRIFADGLKVSSALTNVSGFCAGCSGITQLVIPDAVSLFSQISNWSYCFQNCVNLTSVSGFNYAELDSNNKHINLLFDGCSNLEHCDFRMPNSVWGANGYNDVFRGCERLDENFWDLWPLHLDKSLSVVKCERTFQGCTSLWAPNEEPDRYKLWEDKSRTWSAEGLVETLPASARQYFPVSWGGTGTYEWLV